MSKTNAVRDGRPVDESPNEARFNGAGWFSTDPDSEAPVSSPRAAILEMVRDFRSVGHKLTGEVAVHAFEPSEDPICPTCGQEIDEYEDIEWRRVASVTYTEEGWKDLLARRRTR